MIIYILIRAGQTYSYKSFSELVKYTNPVFSADTIYKVDLEKLTVDLIQKGI